MTLHHVALGAVNVERLAAFYRDVLGLPELTRHAAADGSLRSVWLGLGSQTVLMIEATHVLPHTFGSDVRPGFFLLAFHIAEADRGAWEARLTAGGAVIEQRTAATSYTRDPEGNRIAVSFYTLPESPTAALPAP